MNHDLTVNSPLRHLINVVGSHAWDNRFVLSCASDALIQGGDTITFNWTNGHFVKMVTVDVLESELWFTEDGREVYINLVQIDR